MNLNQVEVRSAKWDGEKTTFTFNDGSKGVQHYKKIGHRYIVGDQHALTIEQHQAVVRWLDTNNRGQGAL